MADSAIDIDLDVFFRNHTALGGTSDSIQRIFYGIDHRQMGLPVSAHKETQPLILMTRPQLNMTEDNLRSARQFIPLLTTESMSYQRAIRCLLDPRLHYSGVSCPMVDPYNPFIGVLSNTMLSCSGWPGFNLESYTSKPGVYKEVFSMVDSIADFNSAFTMTANFRNIPGDPITAIFSTWCKYQQDNFLGVMMPYGDFIVENEIDYQSGLWALVLDYTKTYVQKIAKTIIYPTGIDHARSYDYTKENKPYSDANQEVSIQFQAVGACYNDPILFFEFNQVVEAFNPDMWDSNRSKSMKKIPKTNLTLFNGKGYPRIDPYTSELEWWIKKDEYNAKVKEFTDSYKLLTNG
jgi:hypothetical protein